MSSEDAPEPVGYKRPPQHSRFQKGQSGNPSGRRKTKPIPNVLDVIGKIMMEPIQLVTNGKSKTITRLEGFLRKTIDSGSKGDAAAMREMIRLVMQWQAASAQSENTLTSEQEQVLLEAALERLASSRGGGRD